jgi:hypothetical protein
MAAIETVSAIETMRTRPAGAARRACVRTASRRGLARRLPVRALPREGASLLDEYERPLYPLTVPEHRNRYQPVDDSETKFEEFKTFFNTPDALLSRGHLFVVTGDRGYGKTSLRQRCAYWICTEYNQKNCEIVVVDLSDEGRKAETVDEQMHRVRLRILKGLAGRLDPADIALIAANADIEEFFHDLGIMLRTRGIAQNMPMPLVLLVLFPGYPTSEGLERYYELAREGMVFMAEIFHPDTIRDITRKIYDERDGFNNRNNIYAHILRLGTLKLGDDDLLMTWMQANEPNCPGLTNGEVRASVQKLIQEKKISASEFMKLLVGSLKVAMADHATEVTVDHVLQFYQNNYYLSAD